MENKAIVDIGSNSIRVIIYEVSSDLTFKIIDEEKKTIRLGSYLDSDCYLSNDGIEKAVKELAGFKVLCDVYEVKEIYAVATEAIRKAKNRDEFCNKIKMELGIDIRILSGKEEAFYGYLAIKNTMEEKEALLLDIGGSSLEITLMKDGIIKEAISLPLGCIPLTKEFNNILNDNDKNELKKFIINKLEYIPWIRENSEINIIGIGGTIRNIAKVNKKSTNYPLDLTHNYKVKINELKEMYDNIQAMDITYRSKVKGLSKDRADIFVAPLGAIYTIMDYCNSPQLLVSEVGIREGLIYDITLKGKEMDLLQHSLNSIKNNFALDDVKSKLLFDLSARIYEFLGNNNIEYKLLKAATQLFEIGRNIGFKAAHNNSFYMITNTNINGLTHKEIVKVAYIVSMIWKKDFKIPQEYKMFLLDEDKEQCKRISSLIYISYTLVRYLKNDIYNIDIESSNNIIKIKIDLNKYTYIAAKIDSDRKNIIRRGFNKAIILI